MLKCHKDVYYPEFIPQGAGEDTCIFENRGSSRLKTSKFPSPTSCLPKKQTEELEREIDAINELLLNFRLSNEQPELGKMKSLEGLMEQLVEIELDCEEEIEVSQPITEMTETVNQQQEIVEKNINVCGVVCFVGRDFVVLRQDDEQIIIPLSKIISIKTDSCIVQPSHKPRLLKIDSCLRKSLTLNFGETVSCSPDLIQLFFKTTLAIFLLNCLHKNIKIKIEEEEIEGHLVEVTTESMLISLSNDQKMDIPFHSICLITL